MCDPRPGVGAAEDALQLWGWAGSGHTSSTAAPTEHQEWALAAI